MAGMRTDDLPAGPNDFNLYAGLIALGLGLLGCVLARCINGGHGPRPRGDALSWLVHTRLGPGPKSALGRQLELGTLLAASYGELLIVSIYVGWLAIRFAWYLQHYSLAPAAAVRVGKAFGRLGPPMTLMSYLLAQRYTIWSWVAGIPHERLVAFHRMHGWAFYFVIFAHMVCMAVAMRQRVDGQPVVRQIDDKMSIMQVNPQLGVAAFIMWSYVVFSSFNVFRRLAYSMWYANHFAFFPAVVLTLFHNRRVHRGAAAVRRRALLLPRARTQPAR
jgi:hypothetical protein